MLQLLEDRLDEIIALCVARRVTSISVFGSAARDEMTPESDVDFLVRFSEDIQVLEYADNYFALKEELEQIVGRKIDIVSSKSLRNPVLKEEINRTKIDLYAA
ncbi:MAG: nucleotidyltransferase domain-containing protein [Flavobacteriales bacterium]|nr:nucleotidyltransferase domain-containing protein [Flavobacteriales bacterium]